MSQRRVGLVSIDQYRVGATEQLQCFADLIGCPMHIAHDTSSSKSHCVNSRTRTWSLLTLAGRSPKDRVALANMAECLYGVQEPVEVQLCIPVVLRDGELQVAIDRHHSSPHKANLHKTDEALYPGAIIAAQVLGGLPLTYFTTGQRVPEDIERANALSRGPDVWRGDLRDMYQLGDQGRHQLARKDGANSPSFRKGDTGGNTFTIAVTSGKGGVGKTQVSREPGESLWHSVG